MACLIIWTAEADNDLFKIAEYLKVNWSQNSAEKFITHTLNRIEKTVSNAIFRQANK